MKKGRQSPLVGFKYAVPDIVSVLNSDSLVIGNKTKEEQTMVCGTSDGIPA